MKKSNKSRAFAIMLYPQEDKKHFEALMKIREIYKYAIIEHDKDTYEEDTKEHAKGELKKSHIHALIKFDNPRSKSNIANILNIEDNYIQQASFVAYARYLIHLDDPQKHQYKIDDIKTNMKEEIESAIKLKGSYKRHETNTILEYIKKEKNLNFYKLVMWAKDNGYLEEITKNAYFYKNLVKG